MELWLFLGTAFGLVVYALWRSRARNSWKEGQLGSNTADELPDKMQPPPRWWGGPTDTGQSGR
ncbi:MAG: hypothetical protein FIA92_11045 [Chloroflexi bacterium]|nr:hypothetical protein [Chloroflexota bacterium]